MTKKIYILVITRPRDNRIKRLELGLAPTSCNGLGPVQELVIVLAFGKLNPGVLFPAKDVHLVGLAGTSNVPPTRSHPA
ncbi:hypothetical protein RSAG8_11080, partial [Rhizoctonia solani AG-8 WAC10335]